MDLDKLTNKQSKNLNKFLAKEKKKKIASYKKRMKKFYSTYDWVEIEDITDDYIQISNKQYFFGIKIIPPKISTFDDVTIQYWVDKLNTVINSTALDIYHFKIESPINIDAEVLELTEKIAKEKDVARMKLYQNELENYRQLSIINPKVDYMEVVVGDINNKKFMKDWDDFVRNLLHEQFEIEKLNKIDFDNFLAFVFENDMINDFYFSRNVFEYPIKEDKHVI